MAERILAGVTTDTFKHLQLGVGAIIRNFDYTSITTPQAFKAALDTALQSGQSLGGTLGGINVSVTPTTRKIEIDGAGIPFKGDKIIDFWQCYFECTLKEFTTDVMKAAFPTSIFSPVGTISSTGGIMSQKIATMYSDEDYVTNYTWVATTQYGYLMVSLFNALGSTTGAIAAADKAEGGIPFRADGHLADFINIDYAPCEIWFVDMVGGQIDMPKVVRGA